MSVMEDYRERQVEMLKEALKEESDLTASLRTQLALALDRAERAEEALRTLRQEIEEVRPGR